jgi:hypothetical protein
VFVVKTVFLTAKIWRKWKEVTHMQYFVVARIFEDILIVLGQERYIPLLRGTVSDLTEMCCQHNAVRPHTASTVLGCQIINTHLHFEATVPLELGVRGYQSPLISISMIVFVGRSLG